MKYVLSLCLLFLTITLSPVSAEETNVLLLSGTTIYTDAQETTVLEVVNRDLITHVQSYSDTHSQVEIGNEVGFVKINDIHHPKRYYVIREATTKDEHGNDIAPLPFHSTVQVFDVRNKSLVQTIDGIWVERTVLSDTPLSPKTYYVKATSDIYSMPNGEVIDSIAAGESVQGYGELEGYLRIDFNGRFLFVLKQNVNESPVKTGHFYLLTSASYYKDFGQTKLGTLPRGERVDVYGIDHEYARVLWNKGFIYIKRSDLTDNMPTYKKTGFRYAKADTYIYRDQDKKEIIGTIKRSTKIDIYGTEGDFTRVLVNNLFFFVETSKLGISFPPYLITEKNIF